LIRYRALNQLIKFFSEGGIICVRRIPRIELNLFYYMRFTLVPDPDLDPDPGTILNKINLPPKAELSAFTELPVLIGI
jgi:hypothetical protein